MELLSAFPDIEDYALALLAPVGTTVLATPATITPPLVVIRRIGGSDDLITDTPRIQVDCFGGTRRQTADMAERCRQLILAAPATGIGTARIDQAQTVSAPTFLAYDDQHTQRTTATYHLSLRRPR
jgi:hypothetical protein